MVANPDQVLIFDTTLRDGEQSPGCSMTRPEKLRVARALAELGVDVIEAGFPAASRGDFESVEAVAREVPGPSICGLARCNFEDIELAARALAAAPRHRIHVFLATSAIHRQYKLNMAQDEILRLAAAGVARARELCDDVEFSPEDASRTELEFLAQVIEAAIGAGATTVNIPDTVGYTVPDEFAELFRYLRKNVRGIDTVRLSVHCHDDLGMAVGTPFASGSARWGSSSMSSSSTACSRSSRRWRTRRRSCSTGTSRRWCCARGLQPAVPGRSPSSPPRRAATLRRARWCGSVTPTAAASRRVLPATGRWMRPSRRSRRRPASRSCCASSRCTPFPRARMHRARRGCTWSTITRPIEARA